MTIPTNLNNIPSPCISSCCLDKNDVCMGCYREISEIVGWQNKSKEQKEQILNRCEERKKGVSKH